MPGKLYPAPANSNPDKEDDSEDTSEEEDTEDTETDDQEQDDAEEEEEGEEDSESEETDEDEEGESTEDSGDEEQYIDLKNVPPQLQIAAKKMLASHTKAMQKVKSQLEAAQAELNEQYSQHVVKAAGFDKLVNAAGTEKLELFWEDIKNGKPYGYSSEFRINGESSTGTPKKKDASAPADGKVNVDDIVNRLTPVIQKIIEREIGPMKSDRNKALWAEAEKLPNFKLYKPKITEIMTKHPTLTIEEAYNLAGGSKEAATKIIKESKEAAKKLPKTLKPGGAGGGKPLSASVVNSIEDALNLASRDMIGSRRGG